MTTSDHVLKKLTRTLLTLNKRVVKLRALVSKCRSEAKLLKAASAMRDARIQVLRVMKAEIPLFTPPLPEQIRRIAKIDSEIDALNAMTPEAVLSEFKSRRRSS